MFFHSPFYTSVIHNSFLNGHVQERIKEIVIEFFVNGVTNLWGCFEDADLVACGEV